MLHCAGKIRGTTKLLEKSDRATVIKCVSTVCVGGKDAGMSLRHASKGAGWIIKLD
jgi:hypothetical protein